MWLRLFALFCIATTAIECVQAATLIVTSTADSGAGSLRDTIAAASDGDIIQFDAALDGQIISLTSNELVIDKNIAILGLGSKQLTIQRNNGWRTCFPHFPCHARVHCHDTGPHDQFGRR